MQKKGYEARREYLMSRFGFLRMLRAAAMDYFACRSGFVNNRFGTARSFLVLTLVFSLISTGILTSSTSSIDAFAQKKVKEIF